MAVLQQAMLMAAGGTPPLVFASQVVTLPSSSGWYCSAYDDASGKWLITSTTAAKSTFSSDGITWGANVVLPNINTTGVAADSIGQFVAVMSQQNKTAYGTEAGWTGVVPPGSFVTNVDLIWNGANLIWLPYANDSSYYSDDAGHTWKAGGAVPAGVTWNSLAGYNSPGTQMVAVPVGGDYTATCSDAFGLTWTNHAGVLPASGRWNVRCNGTGNANASPRFVAVMLSSATSAASDDGITWATGTLPAVRDWVGVVWCQNTWVAFAAGTNKCATSADGITWVEQTLAATVNTPINSLRPADANGQLCATVLPLYGTNQALYITTA